MLTSLLLGIIQGTTEWLPVSSEGIVATVYTWITDRPFADAVAFALWLHIGTVVSVLVALRRDVVTVLGQARSLASTDSAFPRFLAVSTGTSVLIAPLLLLTVQGMSGLPGGAVMGFIGLIMLASAVVQGRRSPGETRGRENLSMRDALLLGVMQGISVLPGISRSGLTIATLLWCGLGVREALVVSFLMSIPAGLAAAIVGIITIRALLAFAQRINFGAFVAIVGVALIASAVWYTLAV
jgi:undecaprenyl-diphosphatase